MEEQEDNQSSNASASETDSSSELGDAGRDASTWARNFAFDDALSNHFPSVFDAFFTQSNRSSKTSSNVFSQLVPALSPEEIHERIQAVKNPALDKRIATLSESHTEYFPAYLAELAAGFNILFYGFGSKRKLLNKFARQCAKKGHLVIANAFFPNFTLKDFLSSAENVIGAPELPNAGSGPEAQCRRILEKYVRKSLSRHLFLIIHNIEGQAFRSERSRNCLASLAAHPSIHIVASVDHIMAPLLWSTSESFGQHLPSHNLKDSHIAGGQTLPSGGFNWLWHDLTSMQPYDFELAYADRTSYAGASAGVRGRGAQANIAGIGASGSTIAEGAAKHVLASVTAKAKRLFALMCTRQQLTMDAVAAESGSKGPVQPGPNVALSYDLLFAAARDEFIATNDTAMQALLGEFRDHGLVIQSTSVDGGTSLWIPLTKDALGRLASEIS